MRLSIVTLGHVHSEDLAPLTTRFEHLEQLVLDIPPRVELSSHRAEFNRAVDAASTDWLLIVREREVIDDALATEIHAVASDAKAPGFRIRSIPFYAGKPLHLTRDDGELRLFHRRHLLRRGELTVQGTIMRLANPLRSITFASANEHREHLAKNASRRSVVKRVLTFAGYLLGVRTLDANTLQYLWIEAGFAMP
ncbi:MAG TPA: hypothetical protein VKB93_02530 [Thermoanaerobaculia bacterium]|nr:hypothetical protein [Thermoanaerobaculia bacterium]